MKDKPMKYLLYLITAVVLISCGKSDDNENENGVKVKIPLLWERSIHDVERTIAVGVIETNVYHNGDPIVTFSTSENSSAIRKINIKNGEILWSWDEFYLERESARFDSFLPI
ncbi:hypothetical protein N9L92_03950 [Saprospiraceae bacterium]|nr:hypothetical protein [Saprospiraceae bacterium]